MSGFSASVAQRRKVAGMGSVYSGQSPCDPAHVIDRIMLKEGQDDPLAVVPLTRLEHRLYDDGKLDLLSAIDKTPELAFAVERFGLLNTLERVTNVRWRPVSDHKEAA